MTFKVYDTEYTSRLYMTDAEEVQFKEHVAAVSPQVAYRMSRNNGGREFVIEQKRVPFNPASWTKDRRIIWCGNYAAANGYGMVAENTARWLSKLGVTVQNPKGVSGGVASGGEYTDPDVAKTLKTDVTPDCIEIQHCQPPSLIFNVVERIWTYTMFESTHTPKSWIDLLNRCERVIVPASWLVESWREQGLTVPISVIGHGIDTERFYDLERPVREEYTFVHYCKLALRKGTDLVYQAFKEEFGGKPGVRLILKNTEPFCPVPLDVPNIEFISATYSKEQMTQFLYDADCMLFPTRGEGFGLPAFEALATGLPTIVTGWSGPVDYSDPDDTLILKHGMSKAVEMDMIYREFFATGEDAGEWAEPSLDDLKAKMRWCYENRGQALAMGKRAAARIASSWTWERKMAELVALLATAV